MAILSTNSSYIFQLGSVEIKVEKKKEDGNSSESTILKTKSNERDKTKQCNYCKGKGWRGIGHIDEECFMKKREIASEKEIKK
jgi:hypothetical protein